MHAFVRVSFSQSAENFAVTLTMETEQGRSLSETPMHSSTVSNKEPILLRYAFCQSKQNKQHY